MMDTSQNSIKPMMARYEIAQKRSLQKVSEHFEQLRNTASAASVSF
jgi:hypothetical protein